MKKNTGKNGNKSLLNSIGNILLIDPYHKEVRQIADKVWGLPTETQKSVLLLAQRSLELPDIQEVEVNRVAVVKTLVALLPYSAHTIKDWLSRIGNRYTYEVHFTFFCFLDETPYLPRAKEFVLEVPLLIEKYLMQVKTNTASSAWMAGDLLGDHWLPAQSFDILVKTAKKAKYPAGREGALHGLEHLIENVGSQKRQQIVSVLEYICKNDINESVRTSANLILEKYCK
jgi:hypothetical protein